jgi:hypothetical protein
MDAGILQKEGVSWPAGRHMVRNMKEDLASTFHRKKYQLWITVEYHEFTHS